jgi:hypothetical protein
MKYVYKFPIFILEDWISCIKSCRFRARKNFAIVELNGAASEPTIYDEAFVVLHGKNS